MKVSIITGCKNSEKTIETTINSVISQAYNDLEYIIIDGASTDNTLKIIDKYKTHLYFKSEPDNGLYYAMNKGVAVSTGDILFFLNADDVLYDKNVISDVVNELKKSNADFLYGDLIAINPENRQEELQKSDNIDKLFWMNQCICHQVIFYKKFLFDKYGLYDEKYKIAADYDFNLRVIIKNKHKTHYYSRVISKFTLGGFGQSNKKIYYEEQNQIALKYFGSFKINLKKFLFKQCRSILKNKMLKKIINFLI